MITRINEVRGVVKHISCDRECKFNSTTCHSNQKLNNDKCQCECKKYPTTKKDYSWNPRACIRENSRYLKSIADCSVIVCNEIINAMDSGNVTNTISTNVKSTVSINSCHSNM